MLTSDVVLSGRYRLDDRVATGGMGDVWRAKDLVLGRQVAVKVLLPALVNDPDFIARFRSEARIMASLRHPGVVQVFDCGEDELPDGSRADYLVMEFVDGEPLSRRIEDAGQLEVAETMSIVAQVAQALHGAHGRGIVHRDVKPSNLLVQDDGTVVLVDFGVARSTNVTSITSTNAVPGTALYMAPEQASGRPVSGATDVYALGAVAYCCLTGSPPFTGDNPLQVAVRHLDDAPPELPAEIPAPVRELVARALAKDPADRYPSAAAMADAARAARSVSPTATVPAALRGAAGPAPTRGDQPVVRSAATAAAPRRRGRRGALVGAAGAVLVAVTALGAMLAAAGDAEAPATQLDTNPPAVAPSNSVADTAVTDGPTSSVDDNNWQPAGSSGRPSTSTSVSPSASPTGSVQPSPSATPSTAPTAPSTAPTTSPPPAQTTAPTETTTTTTAPADGGGDAGGQPVSRP